MLPCGTYNPSYAKDIAIIRTRWQWLIFGGTLIWLFTFPLYGGGYFVSLINHIAILVIAVLGLQIVTGYCGQVSLGQAVFMAVGGYTSAILTLQGLPFWVALPIAGIVAGLIGVLAGGPSLRVKGFYLALATLAAHFLIMWLVIRLDITGHVAGLHPPPPSLGDFVFNTAERMYYIIIAVMLLMTFAAQNLVRTRVGRVFVAIRDNDLAAQVMGINLYYYKLLAFFIGCFYAGIAGALWGHWLMVIHPEMFTIVHAVMMAGMIIVGGLGTISGVFFGVIFLRLVEEAVLMAGPIVAGAFPALGLIFAAPLIFTAGAVVIILFLIFEPRGLAHRWHLFKASYRLYPFAY